MISYKIRIDSHDRDNIKLLLGKYSDRYMLAFEGESSENPHCHGLFASSAKPATIRSNLRKQFGKGNGSYSMKELDEEYPLEYMSYIVKEGNYIVHNIPTDIIEKAVEHDKQVKLEMKTKKENRKTILDQIIAKYNYEEDPPLDTHQVIDNVIDFYKTERKPVREFAMVSNVQTLLLRYVDSYRFTLSTNIFKAIDKSRM